MVKDFSVEIPVKIAHELQELLTYIKSNASNYIISENDTFDELFKKYKLELELTSKLEYLKMYSNFIKTESQIDYQTIKDVIIEDQFINTCNQIMKKKAQDICTKSCISK